MSIDWFTFTAQIFNFLVLVLLLRWLLYGRIINAMQEREEKIAQRVQEADERQSEADEKAEAYARKLAEVDEERENRIKEARREADAERKRLLEEARSEIDQRRQRWQEEYERERDDVLAELRNQSGKLGVDIARQTLQQLAGADLQQRMYDQFGDRIQEIDEAQREEILQHLGNGAAKVSVVSAYDLDEKHRERIRETVVQLFGGDGQINFETNKELICGIELDVGGYSFGWNVKEFIGDVELEFDRKLRQ